MFSRIMQSKSDHPSLWEQCQRILHAVNPDAPVQEVDRLVLLISREVMESYEEAIQEAVASTINGFTDLPF